VFQQSDVTIPKTKEMKEKTKLIRVINISGTIALIAGAIDPLEGSSVIAAGSVLIALSTYLTQDQYWKLFFTSMVLIIIGVIFMFYFSSLGGFGGKSTLSWWWGILILPYPAGWLTAIILLLIKAIKRKRLNQSKSPAE